MNQNSVIYQEIIDISQKSGPRIYKKITFEFLVDGMLIPVLKLLSKNYVGNFITGEHSATETVVFVIGAGTWIYDIFPHADILQAVVTESIVNEMTEEEILSIPRRTWIYDVILGDESDTQLANSSEVLGNRDVANDNKQFTLNVQITPVGIDVLHNQECGGFYHDQEVGNVLYGLCSPNQSATAAKAPIAREAYLAGRYEGIVGCDMVPSDNTVPMSVIEVPIGTRTVQLHNVLQDRVGIYSRGMASFIMNGIRFIFPPYDFTRYERTDGVLTIANIDALEMAGSNHTFEMRGNNPYIIATGDSKVLSTIMAKRVEQGNGKRYVRSRRVMEGFGTTTNGVTKVKTNENVVEGVIADNRDGKNFIRTDDKVFSDNVFKQSSEEAAKDVSVMLLQWENGNRNLLYPGMPTRVLHQRDNQVFAIDAVLSGITESTINQSQVPNESIYQTTVILEIQIKNYR